MDERHPHSHLPQLTKSADVKSNHLIGATITKQTGSSSVVSTNEWDTSAVKWSLVALYQEVERFDEVQAIRSLVKTRRVA